MRPAKPPRTASRPFAALTVAAVLATAMAAPAALAQKHGDQPQRSRVLLVFAPDENNKALLDQYAKLQSDNGEVDAEDVDVVYVIGDHMVKLPPPDLKTVPADELRKHYHVDTSGFRIVLVGDDGWEKKRWSEPTDVHLILAHAPDMPKPKSALDQK